MVIQLLVASFVSVINIMIHALATVTAVGVARRTQLKSVTWPRLHLMAVMVATALVLMLAHMIEVVVWSLFYGLVSAAPEGSDVLYFAFVNYTTLGYGDVTPVKEWRLVGPAAAMNGILLFGWSTAILFQVLLRSMEHLRAMAAPGSPFSSEDRG